MGNDIMHCDEHALLADTAKRTERKLDALAETFSAGMNEARQERQTITGRLIRIEAKAEGRSEATGEAMAQSGHKAAWWKTRFAGIAILVALVLALLSAVFTFARSLGPASSGDPQASATAGLRTKGP